MLRSDVARSLKSLHFEFGVILPRNGVNNYVVMSKLPLLAHTSTLGIRAGLEKTRIRSRMATPNMTQGHNNVWSCGLFTCQFKCAIEITDRPLYLQLHLTSRRPEMVFGHHLNLEKVCRFHTDWNKTTKHTWFYRILKFIYCFFFPVNHGYFVQAGAGFEEGGWQDVRVHQ